MSSGLQFKAVMASKALPACRWGRAICWDRQVIEQNDAAYGNALPVLTDCFAALPMTGFFERNSHQDRILYRGAPAW